VSIDQEIRALAAEQSGTRFEWVRGDSRLVEDLGIEGDAAVALFTRIAGKYRTDLTALWRRWDRHFIGSRLPFWAIPAWIAAVAVAWLVAGWMHDLLYLTTLQFWVTAALLGGAAIWGVRRALPRGRIESSRDADRFDPPRGYRRRGRTRALVITPRLPPAPARAMLRR